MVQISLDGFLIKTTLLQENKFVANVSILFNPISLQKVKNSLVVSSAEEDRVAFHHACSVEEIWSFKDPVS